MKNFIGKYQQQEQENQVFLGKKLEIQVNLFIQGFNCQEQMTFYYLTALGMWEYNERNFDKVLMQACVKISYLLYNAHQLLLRGEYGVANILLRQVFEYLVIGKYFYKQQNEIWAEKWLEDRKYEVYDKILRLLKIPDKKHLCDFWKVLCSLAHATPSSQQISLDGQFNEIDIELSYNVVLILLCCKHVLVNYFYSNRKLMRLIKLSPEVAKEMVDLRQKSAAWIKETTSLFSEDGIKVLKDYKRYWVFKK